MWHNIADRSFWCCNLIPVVLALVIYSGVWWSQTHQMALAARTPSRDADTPTRRSQYGADCTRFTSIPNAFSMNGDVITVYNRMSVHNCKKSCLKQPSSLYCLSASTHPNGTCVLTGYSMRVQQHSRHFRRFCTKGRGCFKEYTSRESRFHTGYINLPTNLILNHYYERADFCRHQCERMAYCVGFDVVEGVSYCPYVEFRPTVLPQYTMAFRHCKRRGKAS